MDKIVLVVPPWQSIATPALGVSLLKANLQNHSLPCEVLYLNLDFADRVGFPIYQRISGRTSTLLGDFLFSHQLFEHAEDALERYIAELLENDDLAPELSQASPGGSMTETLRRLIQAGADWTDEATQRILDRDPWMVGFSSTFQQNCSSLALMRRIKATRPDVVTVIGGANCGGEMGEELFARFPEIDYLGQGECDHSFVELATALRDGRDASPTPGFLTRGGGSDSGSSRPLQSADLEELPHPDFDDYFAQLPATGFADRLLPALVMETSRGCWWGVRQHCTFCGLNADGMEFRSKSGPRALEEMRALVERYRVDRISVVDNILDMKYFKSVLPQLGERPLADLFYEIKANLTKAQVRSLARARITWIQPGIESLSDRTLRLMRKGVTELQNVQLLKWCAEVGVHVGWNHLFGFPGEDETDLEQIAHDASAIVHLEPPFNTIVLHMDRFSPYFSAPEEYGLAPTYPAKPYRHVYPFPEDSLRRLAYFYDSDYFGTKKESPAFEHLKAIVERWRKAHARSHLLALPRKKSLFLLDTRPCATRLLHRLGGQERRIYDHCDKAESLASISKALGDGVDRKQVEAILRRFVGEKLMLEVNGRYLSLATDARAGYRRYVAVPPLGAARSPGPRETLRGIRAGGGPRAMAGALARTAVRRAKAFVLKSGTKGLRQLARLVAERDEVAS